MATSARVDLVNCADEPIHIPGSIQPHGALLFFDRAGMLGGWSANVPALLGILPEPGRHVDALGLAPAVTELVHDCLGSMEQGEAPPATVPVSLAGGDHDCVVHGYRDRVIVEFEARDVGAGEVALFAIKAHGAIDRLRRQKSIQELLATAVREVRAFTGFDRVMAYRFRDDDSGDVVAEARDERLVPYVGQRYPAGDIPPQARRLYVLNTLRMIADASYDAVPMLGVQDEAPLDMSFSVLRSVSPVHVEYLRNMGVGASMSVSIVVGGRLWGLIACHHMTPKRVPYSIRMAVDVLAQVLAATVHGIEARREGELVQQAANVRASLVESLLLEDDPLEALVAHADGLLASTRAQALVVAQYGRVVCRGVDQALGEAIVAALPADAADLVLHGCTRDWPEPLRARLGQWAGLLALPFDPPSGGWCAMLRLEQIEEVAWGGKPEKTASMGPLGERLTPRGSFDAWHETVRGCAQPWEDGVLTHARLMLAELVRASNMRRAQTESTRAQLLAMLGHDLRDPLHSINMAGMVLEKTATAGPSPRGAQGTLGRRIQSSSNRMQRLIGQVLDMSRLDRGQDLGIEPERLDLTALVTDLVEEARLAYPTVEYELKIEGPVWVDVDSARLGQVIANLLSNARHHGETNRAIAVRCRMHDGQALVCVANVGSPIAPDIETTLFNPFKRSAMNNPRNRSGMGLGLYITNQILREHGGSIHYHYEDDHVVFTVHLPLADAPA